jgi:hypothetical protein
MRDIWKSSTGCRVCSIFAFAASNIAVFEKGKTNVIIRSHPPCLTLSQSMPRLSGNHLLAEQ